MRFIVGERKNFLKSKARALQQATRPAGLDLRYTAALELLARMYGFESLSKHNVNRLDVLRSELDEHCEQEVVSDRQCRQKEVLSSVGIEGDAADAVLATVRPTGGFRPRDSSNVRSEDIWAGFDDIDY